MPPSAQRAFALISAVLLCQCGAPQPPRCTRVPASSRIPAPSLLADAQQQWSILANPARRADWPSAQATYNTSVAKLFDQLRCGSGNWESRAATLGTHIGPVDARQPDLNVLNAVFPSTQVRNRSIAHRQFTPGVGVPLIGWKKTSPVGMKRDPYLLPSGLPYNLTATLDFDSDKPTWRFTKRWLYNDHKIGATTHTLAADWTAPNEFFWQMCDLDDLKIQNVILPERYMQETGVYFLHPYDPKKIPVVLVHGLVSSPDAFKTLINDLAPEPWFRERYQVWLFNYPTGNPWPYSSLKFREHLRTACDYARTKGDDTNLNKMVIVSHSMGGLIARSSVTEPSTVLYDAYFKEPIDQLKVTPQGRQLIRDALLYKPIKEPKRVVFLAVPHRGSPTANLRVSLWLSRLIKLPKSLTVELLDSTIQSVGSAVGGDPQESYLSTSINSLSPKSKANIGLNQLPLPKHLTFHSVIGDSHHGSDGVVPYWSSHITPVASELLVPSNHSVPDNTQACEEVQRILKLHLRE